MSRPIIITRETLKQWFSRGKKPTAAQFAAWIDTYFHKSLDTLPAAQVDGLAEALQAISSRVTALQNTIGQQQATPEYTLAQIQGSALDGYFNPGIYQLIITDGGKACAAQLSVTTVSLGEDNFIIAQRILIHNDPATIINNPYHFTLLTRIYNSTQQQWTWRQPQNIINIGATILAPSQVSLTMSTGDTQTVYVESDDQGGFTAQSSDDSVAAVTADTQNRSITVQAISEGTATVTLTSADQNLTATVAITVEPPQQE